MRPLLLLRLAPLALLACVPKATAPDPATAAKPPLLAVTIDDLPWVGGFSPADSESAATARMLRALRSRDVPATGLVTCSRITDEATLRQWVDAGFDLGNHSTSHRDIERMTHEEWVADVKSCGDRLAKITGKPARWFRYPFLHQGNTPARRDLAAAAVKEMGHENAHVSIDTAEWTLVAPYVDALKRNDREKAREIGDAYVEHVVATTRHYRERARETHGREVAQVLLLHANALAADRLADVLDALAKEGVRFASLADALADPVYALPEKYTGPVGLSWLYRTAGDADTAWAWDRAEQRALEARFGTFQIETLDLGEKLHLRAPKPRVLVVTHEEPFAANSLVAEMDDGTLFLVDTPYTPRATRRLVEWLRTRYGKRPLVAVNSHFHWDALGGNAALLGAGAAVWGSDETVRLLEEREEQMRAQMKEVLGDDPRAAPFADLHALPPSHRFALAKGTFMRFGKDGVRVFHPGPAHSPDNVVVHFEDLGVIFGGCMILAGDRVMNRSDADLERWPAAVEAVKTLPADLVVPGHGERLDRGLLDHTLRVLASTQASR